MTTENDDHVEKQYFHYLVFRCRPKDRAREDDGGLRVV